MANRVSGDVCASYGFLRKLKCDRECRRISVCCSCRSQHELITPTSKDPIMLISRGPCSVRGIWWGSMDTIRQDIGEIQLRRELETPLGHGRGANLKVHMNRPPRIPAWVHSDEPHLALRIGDLIAT